jgi:hypothetical protein
MARTEAQSDFVFRPAPVEEPLEGPIGDGTGPVELPRVKLRSSEASAFSTKWVLRLTFLMLLLLALLCAIGPHIPSGG